MKRGGGFLGYKVPPPFLILEVDSKRGLGRLSVYKRAGKFTGKRE